MTHSDNIGFTHFDNVTINTTAGAAPTAYPGSRRIETVYPTSTIANGLTPSDGALANHQLVGEARLDVAGFVAAATPAARDEYAMGDITGTPAAIDALVLVYHAARSDAGARTVRGNILSSASETTGASISPSVSPSGTYTDLIASTDPNTGAGWTTAAVNAHRVELEIVT